MEGDGGGSAELRMPDAETSRRQLAALRTLLRRDYLTGVDREAALRELASMARQALDASFAMVALHDEAERQWRAWSSEGKVLSDGQIRHYGSRSVLEKVRRRGEPILTTSSAPLLLSSESLMDNEVRSVLAVPLYLWDRASEQPRRRFAGCLYAHRSGAERPFDADDVELVLDLSELGQRNLNLLEHLRRVEAVLEASQEELDQLRGLAAERYRLGEYESLSPAFGRDVLSVLARTAHADRVGILLLGPTGSGKSHLAQAYHYACPRRKGPFIVLDCSQVTSSETLAAELFGYAPHSGYANAPKEGRAGKASLADGGTLFLDEISTLPPELQQRLLRLLQTGTYSPLGASGEKKVDLQVIAASNESLRRLVDEGRFREDLYWRLGEVVLRLPSLEGRAEDVPQLARLFLRKAASRFERADLAELAPDALHALLGFPWSRAGNIRGLEHTLSRSVLLAPAGTVHLRAEHLRFAELDAGAADAPVVVRPPKGAAGVAAPAAPAAVPTLAEGRVAPLATPPAHDALGMLLAKLTEHGGVLADMAADPAVASALGQPGSTVPPSTLLYRLRKLGLADALEQARQQRQEALSLDVLRDAIRRHRSATAAARALGTTRDAISWRLRKAGLSVQELLRGGA